MEKVGWGWDGGVIVMVEGEGASSFPCVGRLGDGTGGNHVQQILAFHGRAGVVGGQAGVHVRHGDTCRGQGKCASVSPSSSASKMAWLHTFQYHLSPPCQNGNILRIGVVVVQ